MNLIICRSRYSRIYSRYESPRPSPIVPRVYRRVDVEGGGEPGLGEGEEATISPAEESSHQPAMAQWRQRTLTLSHTQAAPSPAWSRQG